MEMNVKKDQFNRATNRGPFFHTIEVIINGLFFAPLHIQRQMPIVAKPFDSCLELIKKISDFRK